MTKADHLLYPSKDMDMHIISRIAAQGRTLSWSYWTASLALVAGLILSILSLLEVCVEHCSANQDYLLFGFSFATVGVIFFTGLNLLNVISWRYRHLSKYVGWLIAAALGAEMMFIIVQKYQIGHWCPVCLSIAATIAIASISLSINYFKSLYKTIRTPKPGEIMNKIQQMLAHLSFVLLGFIVSMVGIANPNTSEATAGDIEERLAFGKKDSPVVVYFFSDWYCPTCRKVDPIIEKSYPKIRPKATFYFVDYPIHKKSMNFTPYNIAFQINNKSDYFKARTALAALAKKTKAPTDEDIIAMSEKQGIKYKKISFMDAKTGMDFYDSLVARYKLNSTPTVVISNIKTNKSIILDGKDEITEERILKSIDQLIK